MNKMTPDLLIDISEAEKINNCIAELQDIQGMLEDSDLISRLGKVIEELKK